MGSSDEIDLDAKIPAGVNASEAASAIAGSAGVEGPAATAPTQNQAIAQGLASGALDPVAAQQLLIEQILAEQLPPDTPPAQVERLRGELAAALEGDPTLAALLQP